MQHGIRQTEQIDVSPSKTSVAKLNYYKSTAPVINKGYHHMNRDLLLRDRCNGLVQCLSKNNLKNFNSM